MTGLDRRAVFFAVAGLVCLLLVPVTPEGLTWVGWLLAATYAVLSAASLLDDLSRRRRGR